jgi:hypothetical protein
LFGLPDRLPVKAGFANFMHMIPFTLIFGWGLGSFAGDLVPADVTYLAKGHLWHERKHRETSLLSVPAPPVSAASPFRATAAAARRPPTHPGGKSDE